MQQTVVKLAALHKNIVSYLPPDKRARYFDPAEVVEFFERYAPLRDALRAERPELFSDLPVRTVTASGTTDNEGRGYITRDQLEQLIRDIEYCLEVLSRMETVQVPSMVVTREGVFFAGQYFDALSKINEILSKAGRRIVIVDGYVSQDVLNILTAKGAGVEVWILTKNAPPAFVTAAQAFDKQYGKLSVRVSAAFHDRFVIIDDTDFYHFGASLKDVGKSGSMFSRIEEPEAVGALSKKLSDEWSKATVIL